MSDATCVRCGGQMQAGFVIDRGNESVPGTQHWVEGTPERSFLTGLKMKGRLVLEVSTFRCAQCGYLESYAKAK